MKGLIGLGIGIFLGASALLGTLTPSAASTLQGPLQPGILHQTAVVDDDGYATVIKIAHRKRIRAKKRNYRRSVRRHHRKFHKRYSPRKRHYRRAHRRFHRHYRRRHRGPQIYFEIYPDYYDPFHYSPRYYDPYYYGPPYRSRMSCNRARRLVRRHGYHRVRAYDCRGKVYGFIGFYKGKRYKVRVSAYSGRVVSRRRY